MSILHIVYGVICLKGIIRYDACLCKLTYLYFGRILILFIYFIKQLQCLLVYFAPKNVSRFDAVHIRLLLLNTPKYLTTTQSRNFLKLRGCG